MFEIMADGKVRGAGEGGGGNARSKLVIATTPDKIEMK